MQSISGGLGWDFWPRVFSSILLDRLSIRMYTFRQKERVLAWPPSRKPPAKSFARFRRKSGAGSGIIAGRPRSSPAAARPLTGCWLIGDFAAARWLNGWPPERAVE